MPAIELDVAVISSSSVLGVKVTPIADNTIKALSSAGYGRYGYFSRKPKIFVHRVSSVFLRLSVDLFASLADDAARELGRKLLAGVACVFRTAYGIGLASSAQPASWSRFARGQGVFS